MIVNELLPLVANLDVWLHGHCLLSWRHSHSPLPERKQLKTSTFFKLWSYLHVLRIITCLMFQYTFDKIFVFHIKMLMPEFFNPSYFVHSPYSFLHKLTLLCDTKLLLRYVSHSLCGVAGVSWCPQQEYQCQQHQWSLQSLSADTKKALNESCKDKTVEKHVLS